MRIKFFIVAVIFTSSVFANNECIYFYGPDKPELRMIHYALRNHALVSSLTPELTRKSLRKFIEILDPSRFLFLENEIKPLIDVAPDVLASIHRDVVSNPKPQFHKDLQNIAISRLDQFIELLRNDKNTRDRIRAELSKIQQTNSFYRKPTGYPKSQQDAYETFVRFMAQTAFIYIKTAEQQKIPMTNLEAFVMAIRNFKGEIQSEPYIYDESFLPALVAKSYIINLDAHSDVLLPKEARSLTQSLSAEYSGIGTDLVPAIKGVLIHNVYKDSGAEHAGLKPGDIITHVELTSELKDSLNVLYPKNNPGSSWLLVRNLDLSTFTQEIILGRENTVVKMRILRDGKPIEVEVERRLISQANTGLHLENHNVPIGNVAYLKFDSFYVGSADHVAQKVRKAKESNALGFILDLRGNGGGSVKDMIKILGLFVKAGPGIVIKKKTSEAVFPIAENNVPEWDKPLMVLIDNASASASEALSGVLQDYGRAIVVGAHVSSYGKGSTQIINPVGNATLIRLTTNLFSSPGGGHKQFDGVIPDILIETPMSTGFKFERDTGDAIRPQDISPVTLPEIYIPNRADVIKSLKSFQRKKIITEHEMNEANTKDIDLLKTEALQMMSDLIGLLEK
ncbi:MAG: hypothetical protein JNL11_10525 [Bdellovibrionaceae bacterium]|nr:hypothetical protein [Pseudobdellovibrionaceae bacterium]